MPPPTQHSPLPPDGLVLCGGLGRRLGGLDKGLLPVGPHSAAEHALHLLRPLCRRLYISANRHHAFYEELDDSTLVADRRTGFPGPLAALEALQGHPLAPTLLVLPCDMPLLDRRVLHLLLQRLEDDAALDLVHARGGGRDHYLCAALRTRCLAGAAAHLDRRSHSVRGWLESLNVAPLETPTGLLDGLRNFNHREDWEALGSGPAAGAVEHS
jgi:molybdopterin-guanine dinucleotide biosynthesis protein A